MCIRNVLRLVNELFQTLFVYLFCSLSWSDFLSLYFITWFCLCFDSCYVFSYYRLLCTTFWSQPVENARILIRRFGYFFLFSFYFISNSFNVSKFQPIIFLFPLKIFEEMKKYEVKPNGQTYVCLLNACAAAGMLDPVYVSSFMVQLCLFISLTMPGFPWLRDSLTLLFFKL